MEKVQLEHEAATNKYFEEQEELYEQQRTEWLESEARFHRENNSPRWEVEAIDNELGRSLSEIDFEDDSYGYEPNCDRCGKEVSHCRCCDNCGFYPCECCYNCKSYPCECCTECGYASRFCKCCVSCGNYRCTCD